MAEMLLRARPMRRMAAAGVLDGWWVSLWLLVAAGACQPPGAFVPEAPVSAAAVVVPEELAAELDQALSLACPLTDLDDADAHEACADALTQLPLLKTHLS